MLSQPILVHLTVFMVQLLCATRFPLRGIWPIEHVHIANRLFFSVVVQHFRKDSNSGVLPAPRFQMQWQTGVWTPASQCVSVSAINKKCAQMISKHFLHPLARTNINSNCSVVALFVMFTD
jgi:hypothetical protein